LALDPLYLAVATEAALAAGQTHRRYFRHAVRVDKKGPIDLVTAADLDAERDFRQLMARRFPSHAVLGEEGSGTPGAAGTRFRWIVDPLDGTTNFAHGVALFCISIGLEVDGRVDLAVVYDPIGEELFTAERGEGARLNGVPIRVSARDVLLEALVVTGFPYSVHADRGRQVDIFGQMLSLTQGVRRLGSAALDLAYVAAGRFEGFWEQQLHAWDIAAGQLLVSEAGGRVTNYAAGPLDLFQGEILATNWHLHEAIREVIVGPNGP
jgi:myo-inositol-1(or 4)-monophosphatase